MSRTDTGRQVLDLGEALVMERGYHAFSYQDISSALGIRNAAVHYHFRTKAGLVEAVLQRYRARFVRWRDALREGSVEEALRAYAAMVRGFVEAGRICPLAMMATEYTTLPEPLRCSVRSLQQEIEAWLVGVIRRGQRDGSLRRTGAPEAVAAQLVCTLSGAQQLGRVCGIAHFDRVVAQGLAGLGLGEAAGEVG